MNNPSLYIAFAAGFLSFFTPCVLPLIPSYIMYITGVTLKDLSESRDSKRIMKTTVANSLLFILGFSLVFILLGVAASLVGRFLFEFRGVIRMIGGTIIIVFGLYLTGIFRLRFLDIEKRFSLKAKPAGYFGSFLVGVTFAAAWIPCVGPILGSILVLAGTSETLMRGILLLISYSLGLATPFFLTSISLNSAMVYFKRISKYLGVIEKISGVFLILIGLLLLTNQFQSIITYLTF